MEENKPKEICDPETYIHEPPEDEPMFTFDVTKGPSSSREEIKEKEKVEAGAGDHGGDEMLEDGKKINIDVSVI